MFPLNALNLTNKKYSSAGIKFCYPLWQIKSNRDSSESPLTVQEPTVSSQSNSEQLPDILSEPSGTRKRSTDSAASQMR